MTAITVDFPFPHPPSRPVYPCQLRTTRGSVSLGMVSEVIESSYLLKNRAQNAPISQ